MSFKKIADTSFKKQFRKLVLVMIALQIIFFHVILFCFLCMFICFCCCFWGACFVQISDNVSSPFSSKTFFLPSKFFSQKAYKSIIKNSTTTMSIQKNRISHKNYWDSLYFHEEALKKC